LAWFGDENVRYAGEVVAAVALLFAVAVAFLAAVLARRRRWCELPVRRGAVKLLLVELVGIELARERSPSEGERRELAEEIVW
jgi:hypothetical protein